ncbi:MAG: hypothetical protein ACI4T6_09515, partial [Candidatus Flemingiibacterium sp.]
MQRNTITRRAALALSLILTASAFISCQSGAPTNNDNTTDTTPADTTTLSAEEARKQISDGLPERDYGGEEFNITINTYCESGFHAEELTGDVLSDAIYERNKAVEDRFNVKFNFISDTYDNVTTLVQNSVLSGDDEYQLCAQHALKANSWALADILMN